MISLGAIRLTTRVSERKKKGEYSLARNRENFPSRKKPWLRRLTPRRLRTSGVGRATQTRPEGIWGHRIRQRQFTGREPSSHTG